MKTIAFVYSAALWCSSLLVFTPVHAEVVTVRIERAANPAGPWTPLDLKQTPTDPDGNPRLPLNTTNEFFRTRLELGPAVGLGDHIALAEVPPLIRGTAADLVAKRINLGDDPEGWPEGSELSPFVLPLHNVGSEGSQPAYFEFKVLGPQHPKMPGGPLPTAPDEYVRPECGFIILSATTDDFPVCEFATEGPALSETLGRAAKTSRIRVIRYGPGLAVAENEQGEAVASLGSVPFKLSPNVLALDGLEWSGNDTNGTDESPRFVPVIPTEAYPSYQAFKMDLVTNSTYAELRRIKRERARREWDALNGVSPGGITVNVGETVRIFDDLPLQPLPEVSVVSESDPLLRTTVSTTGGIRITGAMVGNGLVRARVGGQERALLVRVASPTTGGGANAPGDLLESKSYYAGDWAMQPKYHQFEDSDWCPVAGCGPVAWAMLFAWFDRNWGVEYAFNGEGSGDPPADTSSSANRSKTRPAYRELHEECDVICAGGSGATWPTDMTEGFKDYTYISKITGRIKREWHINSETGTWPEAGALRCRDAIKNGYPAVVGLGWFWHYTLAYGYNYQIYDMGLGFTVTCRYLKCNMGWGPGTSPRWYNMLDTFYAADVKIWRGPNG